MALIYYALFSVIFALQANVAITNDEPLIKCEDEFTMSCDNGEGCYKVKSPNETCDGKDDCIDGTDEMNCCTNANYSCQFRYLYVNGPDRCIGYQRCGDESDDELCCRPRPTFTKPEDERSYELHASIGAVIVVVIVITIVVLCIYYKKRQANRKPRESENARGNIRQEPYSGAKI